MDTIKFDKYEKKGAYHWKEFKRNTPYRRNALIIASWIDSGPTLDIGAGDGLITSLLIKAVGIDDSKKAVMLARERGVDVRTGDAYKLPFKDGEFNNVLMADTLEHLKYDTLAIKEASRVLTDKGYFYIVTPPAVAAKNKYHYREYTPVGLVQLMNRCGFDSVEEIRVEKELNRMYGKFVKL